MRYLVFATTVAALVFAMALMMIVEMIWFDAKNLKENLSQEPIRYEKVGPRL